LHLLEDLDGDDVEARPSIDESAVDGDAVDRGCAQEGNCAHGLSGDWMVLIAEADIVGRPLQPVAFDVRLCCHDLPRQLLEVMIRQRSLGSS
jgi:hypothetical protein